MGSHLYVPLPKIKVDTRMLILDFSKTLFTPSGIDIYIRASPSGGTQPTTEQRQELLDKVIIAVQGCKVGEIGDLAKKGFQVPGVV